MVSEPYLLDAAAAKAYGEGIECAAAPLTAGVSMTIRTRHARPDSRADRRRRADLRGNREFPPRSFGCGFLRGGRLEMSLIKPVLFGDMLTLHAKSFQSIRIGPIFRFKSRISAGSRCRSASPQ